MINAVLIDFFLYDSVKALEAKEGTDTEEGRQRGRLIPHHRTRSIWY